jgi:predicted RNA binding protein YcfA (HicA-like mRNA interferase family)
MRERATSLSYEKRKLLERLTNNPKGATFDDVRTLLLQEGFSLHRISGSHYIFKKPGITLVIPVHANRVKSVYVKRMIQLINEARGEANGGGVNISDHNLPG